MPALRWGIAGAGSICDDFAAAVGVLPHDEHQVVAVGARDSDRAALFAKKFSIPKSYGSYEALSQDADVDVVYIGTINTTHYDVCKLMLAKGKHVLCEKSLTLLLRHTEELIKLAEEKKLFFQEAVWSRFLPASKKARDEVSKGKIGDVKLITINFCKQLQVEERKVGSGTLMSLDVYPLQLVLAMCGDEMPEKIQACGILNDDGVDVSLSVTLRYKSGAIAQLFTSFEIPGPPDEAIIYGHNGMMKFPKKFHCPTELMVNGQTETFPYPETLNSSALSKIKRPGFVFQTEEVRNCILQGLLESPWMTHQETLTIAKIMEEIKKQIGLNYDDLY